MSHQREPGEVGREGKLIKENSDCLVLDVPIISALSCSLEAL